MLQRFVDVLSEIKTFLSTRNKEHEELSARLLDLGFLTDLMAKLNVLNNEFKGKEVLLKAPKYKGILLSIFVLFRASMIICTLTG